MQILEYSPFGLRSARITLASRDSEITVALFPMLHVAEAAFFSAVYDDAFAHDVVLVEGIHSPIVQRLTRVYRWVAGSPRLGLTLQPRYPLESTVHAKIIHADLTPEEFAASWDKLSVWIRLLLYFGAPIMGLWLRTFGTRQTIAKRLAMEDAPSQAELMNWSPMDADVDEAMLDARDARLVQHLSAVLDASDATVQRIAIVYGAAHVRGVLRALTGQRHYFAERSDWLTVFKL